MTGSDRGASGTALGLPDVTAVVERARPVGREVIQQSYGANRMLRRAGPEAADVSLGAIGLAR
ncbi:hypothetical protein GCM10027344_12420 [Spelaeicoccus albus]